jgi:hypothetical protein
MAVFAGWWYLRNRQMTGSTTGEMHDAALRGRSFASIVELIPRVDWMSAVDSTFVSHIWFGAWSFLQVRSWMYHFFALLTALALIGLARLAIGKPNPLFNLKGVRLLFVAYACFCAGLAYHVLITFAVQGLSCTTGWYLYAMVAAEVILVTVGLAALIPARLTVLVAPGLVFFLVSLEMFATHFYLLPYYAGFIAHRPSGGLPAFRLSQLQDGAASLLVNRLAVNKPEMITAGTMVVLWVLFLAATFALIAIAWRSRRSSGTEALCGRPPVADNESKISA